LVFQRDGAQFGQITCTSASEGLIEARSSESLTRCARISIRVSASPDKKMKVHNDFDAAICPCPRRCLR
jgi:hypothetical protein